MEQTVLTLKDRYIDYKEKNPNTRIRNAARDLEVSEAELVATSCGETVTRLKPSFKEILSRIYEFGYVMALTRNDDAVHEKKGVYRDPKFDSHVGLFLNDDIDLRIFWNTWNSGFAVCEKSKNSDRLSLQFFAKDGEAVHKIYLTENSNLDAYNRLVDDYKSEDQSSHIEVGKLPETAEHGDLQEADVTSFQKEWLELEDTHDFFALLQKYKISRTQALRIAPKGNYAVLLANSALRSIFNLASQKKVPIMVFVGNQGMLQIHTGPVVKLVDHMEWFNVLDPEFNLHLRENAIKESWIVRKPTKDGIVTSLEIFNVNGDLIATIFGKRKPGIPELEEWRKIVKDVEKIEKKTD